NSDFRRAQESCVKKLRRLAVVCFCVLPVISGSAFGQITTGVVEAPPSYATLLPPSAGGSYVDPVFGSTIRRVSNALSTPNHDRGGNLKWIENEYSTMSPFNSDNSKFILVHESYF